MLSIKNINVSIEEILILHELSLTINSGEVHILYGANGSGKSSLALTLLGHPRYQLQSGTIEFNGVEITSLSPDKRAKAGFFLSLQQPIELTGVNFFSFLKQAYDLITGTSLEVQPFQMKVFELLDQLNLDRSVLDRSFEGFSGGERKRLELLQLLLFNPKLAVLDEIDSGIDEKGFNAIVQTINTMKSRNPNFSTFIITHSQSLIEALPWTVMHTMNHGKIINKQVRFQ